MANGNGLDIGSWFNDDGTIQGIIRQIEGLIDKFDKLDALLKKEDFSTFLANIKKGSNDEKVAISALTPLVERLIKVNQELIQVRSESYQQLKNAQAIVREQERDAAKEAEINAKVAGSYAQMNLQLKQLIEQYRGTNDASKKLSLAGDIGKLSASIKVTNGMLKAMTSGYYNLTDAQRANLQTSEELAAQMRMEESALKTRAQAYAASTQAYKDQIQAQKELKQARLEAVSNIATKDVAGIDEARIAKMNYEQLDAVYKQLSISLNNLTSEQLEDKTVLEQYGKAIGMVGDALERYDKTAGRTTNRMSSRQREWNGLTNSVYQITREIPNLAVRVDTFFLAISNNIPIFIDEFRRATKELGSFKKALGRTLGAFLKGSILGIVLFALTKFSELREIWDGWLNTLEDGTLKMGAFYRQLESHVKNASSSVVKQIYNIRMLSKEWSKLDTLDGRRDFLAKYRKEIDETGLSVTNLNQAENAFRDNTNVIVEAYIERAKASAAAALAEENYKVAVEKSIKAEEKASEAISKARGENMSVTERDLREMFARRYGITDAGMIASGDFVLSRETLYKIRQDIMEAGLSGNRYTQEIYKALEQSIDDGRAAISKSAAEYVAAALEAGKGLSGMVKALDERDKALAKGDQAVDKAAEYMDSWSSSLDKAGVSLSDLSKKLNDFDLKSLKALNDAILDLMNNPAYARGGVKIEIPTFEVRDGSVVKGSELVNVSSSFGKSKVSESQAKQERIKEWNNAIEELNRLYGEASLESRITIGSIIKRYNEAILNEANALGDELKQIDLEEAASRAQTYASSLQMRLDALKDGSEQELELRRKLIRANMQAEIAENATLEPIKQQSVSAIRAKYRREEEQAEREYMIKRNNWRKQQLENENEAELSITIDYYNRRRQIQQIELENELLENAELIENGQIKQEDIIRKHLKKQEKLWNEHRSAVLSSQRTMWDVVAELAQTDSWEQLAAKLEAIDIETEQTKIQQQEIIDLQIPNELKRISDRTDELNSMLESRNDLTDDEIDAINKELKGLDAESKMWTDLSLSIENYIDILDKLNTKRRRKAIADVNLRNFEKTQDINAIGFYSQFQVGERQGAAFELQQERELLQYRLDNAEALGYSAKEIELINAQLQNTIAREKQIKGFMGTISAVASHGLAGLIQLPAKDASGNVIKKDGKTEWKDLSTEQYEALEGAIDSVRDNLGSLMQAYADVAQAAYDSAKAQVDAARTVYEAELEARANGYANDVEGAKRELALERRKAKQKEELLKKAQKAQERINTLQQISSLITGSAQILETFAAYPAVAAILIASMWGMFAAAKIQANQLANKTSTYGSGGYELAVGGSHASGNDIKTGIRTKSGSSMVIEGGEGVGVFSRRAVTKYGDIIPSLVQGINDGTYGYASIVDGMSYEGLLPSTGLSDELALLRPLSNNVDLSTVEGLLSLLISKQASQPIVLSDGSIMERKGNKTTITRRG